MNDWQPMETAPKDGTRILAIVDERGARSVEMTQWESKPVVDFIDKPFWLDMTGSCPTYECFRPYPEKYVRLLGWAPFPELPDNL